jgi:hypothetical protein
VYDTISYTSITYDIIRYRFINYKVEKEKKPKKETAIAAYILRWLFNLSGAECGVPMGREEVLPADLLHKR